MVHIDASRDDDGTWTLVADVPVGCIQVSGPKSFAKARTRITDMLGKEGYGSFHTISVDDPELQGAILAHRRARTRAQEALADADRELVRAAKTLNAQMSLRDAAALLGYSHQYLARITS